MMGYLRFVAIEFWLSIISVSRSPVKLFAETKFRSAGWQLVFLRDKNLKACVTLRGRIYRLVGEDDCGAWRDDSSRSESCQDSIQTCQQQLARSPRRFA